MKSPKNKSNFKILYRELDHGDFDAEWPLHDKVSGWWFLVGYLTDQKNPKNLYSYQYTLLKPRVYGLTFYVLHMAFTDFQTGQHLFKQRVSIRKGKKISITQDSVHFSPFASLRRENNQFHLSMKTDEFELKFDINKGKSAFWHGDNGVFIMGLPNDPQQRTVYYSYTNMPTTGEVILHNTQEGKVTLSVMGKSWFDRQWGPFRLLDPASHWEWFSLRFFDEEEVMLFAFPQHPYYDGTYIDKEGICKRVQNYECTPKEFININNFKFSKGWDIILPGIKEENYEIRPLMDGQLNLAYFELMAEIVNPKNKRVGFCFVELLPGVRNPNKRISFWNLLKSV